MVFSKRRKRAVTSRILQREEDLFWKGKWRGLYNWRHFTNAKWRKGHWIGRWPLRVCTSRRVVSRRWYSFSLCVKRACCPLRTEQTRICKTSFRRFIPVRPIKHEDHARIVRPAATDTVLPVVSLIVALATVSLVSPRDALSPLTTFVRSFILQSQLS